MYASCRDQDKGVPAMARTVVLAVLFATVFTLASPVPSHAWVRSGFVTAFPVGTFSRPAFVPFTRSVVVVNPSFATLSSFGFPAQTVFVHEVVVPVRPVVVFPASSVIVISQPVFVAPVRPLFVANGCFFDHFNVLRCVR
jgi:hypothetical protein